MITTYSVGSLVRCREREWVVLPSDEPDLLRLRPLGGTENEVVGIYTPLAEALGVDAIEDAKFPPPRPDQIGDYISGRLLRDAARLSFRSGAGPFRSLGRISVRPRPFQIVPLLMALRLDNIRLLIADDVGVGKTIEAALVAREALDRGEARRLAVVCPPHLCEQWQRELADKFNLDAVVVRSGSIAQLERALPPGDISVFEYYHAMVVSIDFVKSDRRRDSFLRGCPELVIVDEAHTATRSSSRATQQRHALIRDLAQDRTRHMLLLTATPHSGVEDAFLSLLEMLRPEFGRLDLGRLTEQDRRELARHFVQRRRADVQKWLGEDTPFPVRASADAIYTLANSPEYRKLFDDVYEFARELVRDTSMGMPVWRRRVRHWTALALLRCVMSSPAAAEATLRARIARMDGAGEEPADESAQYAPYVLDFTGQDTSQQLDPTEEAIDFEPASLVEEGEAQLEPGDRQRLQAFLKRAAKLRGDDDPKAVVAAAQVAGLLRDGFRPIVYCRYIATAEYVAGELSRRLGKQFPSLRVMAVTGASSEEEREQRVAELSDHSPRVLVATDCLSEGINLQDAFNAVVHYDLPWNPNRLEQREGRVDRFGQRAPEVRVVLLFGQDNPIDQAVLKVLLRKAVAIHKTLGISVPLPVDSESVVEAVVRSLFQEGGQPVQLSLFDGTEAVGMNELHQEWDRAAQRQEESRTRFAQHAIKPEEVAQELAESDLVLGSAETVASFVREACERLGAPLTPVTNTGSGPAVWRLPLAHLPTQVKERVRGAFTTGRDKKLHEEALIGFDTPLQVGAHFVGRTHPLTEALAEYLLDTALEARGDEKAPASRCGVIRTTAVERRTTLLLLRMRLLIETTAKPAPLLAEEMVVAGFEGRPSDLVWIDEARARELLDTAQPAGPVSREEARERLVEALAWVDDIEPDLRNIADEQAAELLLSHRRVRTVTHEGRVSVKPVLPLDVLGAFVLLPVPKGIAR